MAYSDDYLRQLKKKISGKKSIEAETLSRLFFNYLSEVPKDLCWDIFNRFSGFQEEPSGILIDVLIGERLAIVIDLFEGEYGENDLALTDEELNYICEGVNDFALEINDETLMNVMKAAVSRGLMG